MTDQPLTPPQPDLSKFNIDKLFNQYLGLVKLDIRKIPPYQIRETRRAFYGAIGQLLLLQRDELTKLTEEQGMTVLHNMLSECSDYWLKETGRQN